MGSISGRGMQTGGFGSVNSKSQSPLKSDEAFELHKDVSGATAKAPATEVGEVTKQAQVQQTQDPKSITQIKNLSVRDIAQQLANLKLPVTDHNQEIALLLALHGVEISEDSMGQINKLLKGKKSKSAKESAVLLLSKGLGGAVDDVDILNNIMNKNSSISKSLENLNQMSGKMMQLLNSQIKDHPALQSFVATFDDFNDQLKKLKQVSKGNTLLSNQNELLDDLMTMLSFLKGMKSKMDINSKLFLKYIKELGDLNKNLLGQIILSQDSIKQPLGLLESYHYFQLPNPLAAQAVIEMLLRKQSAGSKKNKPSKDKDNQNQEKIIISMDTESMGQITVIIMILGFKVWCTVHADEDGAVNHINSFRNELANNLEKFQYKLEDFKSSRKKINIQKFIAPSQDISEVKRIQTEI